MSQEANKNLVARYYDEMWNKWNFALVDELLAKEISFRGSLGTPLTCENPVSGHTLLRSESI